MDDESLAAGFEKPRSGGGDAEDGPHSGGYVHSGSVRFDAAEAAEVVIEKARSSHVLVRPTVDGQDVGPFILDTGASGLVISSSAAEKLNLRSFGEVFVSGGDSLLHSSYFTLLSHSPNRCILHLAITFTLQSRSLFLGAATRG